MTATFRHEAVLCHGQDEGTAATIDYLRAATGEGAAATMIAPEARVRQIQGALGKDSRAVRFETIERLGQNPARLIPFWAEQLEVCSTREQRLCGVSEALPPRSSADQITEFGIHESCINLAFEGGPAWALLCPYDVSTHRPETIDVVRATHPYITEHGTSQQNPAYRPATPFAGELPAPPVDAEERAFGSGDLPEVRRVAARSARAADVAERAADFALVISEVATNSLRYGGGSGTLVVWADGEGVTCEIRDAGRIRDPLVGRVKPYGERARAGGAGLWIANTLSDLVQIRSAASGTSVRVRFNR